MGLVGLFVPAQKAPSQVAWSNNNLQNLVEEIPADTMLFYLLATLETGKLGETLQDDVSNITVNDVLHLPHAQRGGGMDASGDRWLDAGGLTQSPARKKVVGKWQEDDPDVSMGEGRVGHRQQGHHARLEQVPLLFDPSDPLHTNGMGLSIRRRCMVTSEDATC